MFLLIGGRAVVQDVFGEGLPCSWWSVAGLLFRTCLVRAYHVPGDRWPGCCSGRVWWGPTMFLLIGGWAVVQDVYGEGLPCSWWSVAGLLFRTCLVRAYHVPGDRWPGCCSGCVWWGPTMFLLIAGRAVVQDVFGEGLPCSWWSLAGLLFRTCLVRAYHVPGDRWPSCSGRVWWGPTMFLVIGGWAVVQDVFGEGLPCSWWSVAGLLFRTCLVRAYHVPGDRWLGCCSGRVWWGPTMFLVIGGWAVVQDVFGEGLPCSWWSVAGLFFRTCLVRAMFLVIGLLAVGFPAAGYPPAEPLVTKHDSVHVY